MSVTYGINGFMLGGTSLTEGIWLLRETEYAPALSPRVATVELPNIHYSRNLFDDPLSQITVALKIRVQGRDEDQLRQLWNKLMGHLGMGTNTYVLLSRIRGDTTETTEAKLLSTDTPDFDCGRNRVESTIVFVVPSGAWRGVYTEQQLGTGAGLAVTTVQNSTLPITDAMLRSLGPLDTLEVYDAVSGTGVRWDATIQVPSGQYLLIDVNSMQARTQTTQSWNINTGTQASAGLTYIGYRPLGLTPRWISGATTPQSSVNVTLTGGAAAVTIRSRYAVV